MRLNGAAWAALQQLDDGRASIRAINAGVPSLPQFGILVTTLVVIEVGRYVVYAGFGALTVLVRR